MYGFDMDGVLIDSHEAVRVAYEEAGVIPPDGFWGKSWEEWLPQQLGDPIAASYMHEVKVSMYASMLLRGAVPELPPMDIARKLLEAGETVAVMTQSSAETARLVRTVYGIEEAVFLDFGCQRSQRVRRLSKWSRNGLYIDDITDDLESVPGWGVIQYVEQTSHELEELLWM